MDALHVKLASMIVHLVEFMADVTCKRCVTVIRRANKRSLVCKKENRSERD